MTHVFFDPDKINWAPFLQSQVGGGEGKFFIGTRWQRGYGGFLHSIARFLVPLAKNIATSAGEEGIAAGTRVLSDIAQGRNIKESIKEHSAKSLENLQSKLA